MPTLREIITREAGPLGLELDPEVLDRFEVYYHKLVEVNKHVNLTRLVSIEDTAVKHFLDSLLGLHVLKPMPQARLADIGSGAGFPGLALKAARPEITLTLVESVRKKCRFMEDVSRAMGLTGVEVVWGRAEDVARLPRHRGAYDVATARAVAEIRVLAEYCLPFVTVGGLFVAYKGPAVRDELAAAAKALAVLGGVVEEVAEFRLPLGGGERSLVCIRKKTETPSTYPRRAGTARKKPL